MRQYFCEAQKWTIKREIGQISEDIVLLITIDVVVFMGWNFIIDFYRS